MSNMKRWINEKGITYRKLATVLHQSAPSICQKANEQVQWSRKDCLLLRDQYGLSADFVQDLVPYDTYFAPKHEEVAE